MAFFDFLTSNSNDKRDAKNSAKQYKTDLMDRSREISDAVRIQMAQIANNPGYSPQEQQGMGLAATAPIAGAYGSAHGQLQNKAAMTGNSTGLIPATEAFARAKARDMSTASAGLQKDIGDKRIQGTQFAAQGLIPLYAPTLGAGAELTNSQFTDANKPGWLRSLVEKAAPAVGGALTSGLMA